MENPEKTQSQIHCYLQTLCRRTKTLLPRYPSGKVLQMDACYPFGRSRDLASFDAIDDCSRTIFGKAYDTEDDQNAMDFVAELVKHTSYTIQTIKVDNRYGKDFKTYCEKVLDITVHYNDPYSPQQNGKIERYHKTLKQEFYHRQTSFTDSIEIINYKYRLWQGYYNTQRRYLRLWHEWINSKRKAHFKLPYREWPMISLTSHGR